MFTQTFYPNLPKKFISVITVTFCNSELWWVSWVSVSQLICYWSLVTFTTYWPWWDFSEARQHTEQIVLPSLQVCLKCYTNSYSYSPFMKILMWHWIFGRGWIDCTNIVGNTSRLQDLNIWRLQVHILKDRYKLT